MTKPNYKQIILERLALLQEDVKNDVTDFLHTIPDYNFTQLEVSLKGWFTTRLYKKGTHFANDNSTEIEIIPNRGVGGQDIKQINLKNPQSQHVIDSVDKAVENQFPTFGRKSGNIDGFIRWEDEGTIKTNETEE